MNVIRVIVSAYLLLVLAAWLTDSTRLWGVYHLIFLPSGLAWLLVAIAAIVLWLPRRFTDAVERTINRMISRFSETMIVTFFLICSTATFVAARSRTLLLGDSYKLLAQITEPLIFLPTEQLNLIVHSSLYKLIGSPDVAYLVISLIAGVFFLAAVIMFVARVIGNRTGRIAGITLFLGLAQIQFFFGYVENYAVMTVFTTLFLLLGWLSIKEKLHILWAYAAFAVASAFHMSALFLLPGLLYLLWTRGNSNRGLNHYKVSAIVTAIAALIGGGVFYANFQGNEIFCPLVASDRNPYTLFSLQHLTDTANLLLLIAPLPFLLIVAAALRFRFTDFLKNRQVVFLAVCAAGGLILLFFVDPKLGAVRDWDLLSLYGIPMAFLASAIWLGGGTKRTAPMMLLQAALAVLLVHTVPWIASNASSRLTREHLKKIIQEDIHYTPEYYEGDRLMSWGIMAADYFGDVEEQRRCFKLRVTAKSEDQRAWLFYAWSCYELGQYNAARNSLQYIKQLELLNRNQLERLVLFQD